MFENIIAKEGMEFLAWREVPIAPDILGKRAVECMPYIMQCFVKKPKKVKKGLDFDRKLYIASRVRSIRFLAMQTRCWHVKKRWNRNS